MSGGAGILRADSADRLGIDSAIQSCVARQRGIIVGMSGTPGLASIWQKVCYRFELLGGHALSVSTS